MLRDAYDKKSMNAGFQSPLTNRLLASLPSRQLEQIVGNHDLVYLDAGMVLHEREEIINHLYFPESCLISLWAIVDGSMSLEVGLVGSEGVVGVSATFSNHASHVRAVVQKAGYAIRLKAKVLAAQFNRHPDLRNALCTYSDTISAQATQIAVCSRFHMLEARLARSLLAIRSRLQCNNFYLTHEFLAHTLGVRRVGVTKAASALQERGLISYRRGEIHILDAAGLETASCQCYRLIENMYDKT